MTEPTNNQVDEPFDPEEAARRRDETIRRMIATPPKKHADELPRRGHFTPGKRGS